MKKILIITNMYPSRQYPHYGVFVKNSAFLLKKGGFSVKICKMKKCKNTLTKLINYFCLYLKSIFWGIFGKFDCIYAHFISHTSIPVRVIKFFHPKIKIVENAHGNDVVADIPKDISNIKASHKVLKITDWVIAPSDYYKEVINKEFGFPEARIIVFPSGGIRSEFFMTVSKQEARKKCGFKSDKYYFGYIARMEPLKGWETFLTAASIFLKKLKDEKTDLEVNFLVMGGGSEEKNIRKICEELGLVKDVEFRPLVDQKQLLWYYNALDTFCFPSERESLGLVGLEVMACGIPLICSNARGIQTYAVDEENCLMFHQKNAEELSERMFQFYRMSEEQKKRFIYKGKTTAQQYEDKTIEKNFILAFSSILDTETNM